MLHKSRRKSLDTTAHETLRNVKGLALRISFFDFGFDRRSKIQKKKRKRKCCDWAVVYPHSFLFCLPLIFVIILL